MTPSKHENQAVSIILLGYAFAVLILVGFAGFSKAIQYCILWSVPVLFFGFLAWIIYKAMKNGY